MIDLNLLPLKEKETIIFKKSRHYLLFFWKTIFCILVIFLTLLFSFYLHLSIIFKTQTELIKVTKETPEIEEIEKIERDIKEIDDQITKIYTIQKEIVLWSKVIEDLISSIPQEVYLKNLSGHGSEMIISGFAPTREHLINFEQSLKENKGFLDVYLPVFDLLKKTDITFNISLKFKR